MNLIETILNASGGGAINQIAKQFGINPGQATDIIGQLAPAVTRGLQRNTQADGGLDALMNALKKGNHERYVDNPDSLAEPESINDGNGILGHIFGSKDVSRQLASRASEQTGISDSIIKKILPMVASLAMGALAKKNVANEFGNAQAGPVDGGLLNSFLDADKDGSIMGRSARHGGQVNGSLARLS